ncbi:piRNA biogenesis protein EXD1-like [Mizuhopecten yessoensis]|uniref:piRNA biogenesis protein EXD1-like n=1 Tax=Mizuhopecten yessoensis TaxID=6573 RepID=UPI000B45E02A|nr:piRNA biogenesis protein EXD1-like [Mizuhopecten yessoensis]
MACKTPDDEYTVVEELADVADALTEIRSHALLAIDCEGINLGRAGDLTVLTVATPIKSYIFDILKLGKQVFDDGLRDILEDKTKKKLMFDCRGDADSLQHQFKVRLSGVLDLQLLEVMHRTKSPSASASATSGSLGSTQTDEVESVYGFLRCVELYIDDKKMIDEKKRGVRLLQDDENVWQTRPLSDSLKSYCNVDTSGLFSLFEKLKGDNDDALPRLRVASERYADYFRSMPVRTNGMFENHALLPLYIIPDEGSMSFPFASTKCVGCNRLFPRHEFSKTQLRKGQQKCRVCKKVKLQADVQKNREDNWARDEFNHSPPLYYSSDEEWQTNGYYGLQYSDNYSDNFGDDYGDDDW